MNLAKVNSILEEMKLRLESLHPNKIEEMRANSVHSGKKMSAAKKRLAKLYQKLTAGRSEANKVVATGAKR